MIAEAAPRPGPLAVWWMGARPRTLVAAVVPVLVGASWAGRGAISIPRSLLALVVAVALQIAVNYANDYFDGVSGVDSAARLGPRRLVASGLAPAGAVAAAAIVMVCIAAVAGVVLALLTTPWLIAAGALAVLALVLYSGGPKPYAASGLGEISVFVFFGLAATCGTAFVQHGRLDASVLWLAVPVGLLACALLMVNNLRDIPTDGAVGKRTLAVRLGARRSRTVLIAVVVIALLLPSIGAVLRALPWLVAMTLVTIPLAYAPLRVASTAEGRALVPALVGITRLQLVFGVVLAGALLAS
ncbi:MAG TPA: 1,4-dihydroxy-2-naphthoate polyprenyltransferase [Candidatus Saccharimonadales bacterium]|nr:1,4-dihydroxy-2-naphthoate polyprenyltransferase [Candidatus Saccharimonadales bacterium]